MTTSLPLLDSEISSAIRKRLGELCLYKGNNQIRLPLKSVNIQATVADRIADVTVEQEFHNPCSDPLEAVYTYPLPGGCAVSFFQLKVGDQIIVGKVQERQQARQVYQQALADGKRAALLEQERDDVFTVSLGNLPPGDHVVVTVKYSEKLPYYDNGTTELRLPLVVAPRYIAGEPLERDQVGSGTELDTIEVPDASRISPPRLAPGVNPNVDVSISVKLLNQTAMENLSCSQHATKFSADAAAVTISLSRTDELLDRDFVLRWKIAGEEIKPRFLVFAAKDAEKPGSAGVPPASEKPSFGMLSMVPPKDAEVEMPGRDIIFVLDRSGSMHGLKMVSAVRACSYLVAALGPKDRFAILAFDDAFDWMPIENDANTDHFLVADQAGIESGTKYLRKIEARGGTELNRALVSALKVMKNRTDTAKRAPVIVVLTDGQVGNEVGILRNIQTDLSDNRIFTIGIDTAVNDGFLKRIAALAGGTCTFVQPGTQLEEALNQVGREIGRVLVTDMKLTGKGCKIAKDSIAPGRIPDLYEGRATSCFFQLNSVAKNATIEIVGRLPDGSIFRQCVPSEHVEVKALAQLWAKAHVVDLEDLYRIAAAPTGWELPAVIMPPAEREALKEQIVKLAIEHNLLTRFTAFVAVHEEEVVSDPSRLRTVVQAVHEPQGWVNNASAALPLASLQAMPAPNYMPAATGQMNSYGSSQQGSRDAGFGGGIPDDMSIGTRFDGWGASAPASAPAPRPAPSPSSKQPFSVPEGDVETGTWRAFSPPAAGSASVFKRKPVTRYGSVGDNLEKIKPAFETLNKVMQQTTRDIQENKLPDADEIEKARDAMLDAMAGSTLGLYLPLLQVFVRATLRELLAAIRESGTSGTVTARLRQLDQLQAKSWQDVQTESNAIFNAKDKFWELTI